MKEKILFQINQGLSTCNQIVQLFVLINVQLQSIIKILKKSATGSIEQLSNQPNCSIVEHFVKYPVADTCEGTYRRVADSSNQAINQAGTQ